MTLKVIDGTPTAISKYLEEQEREIKISEVIKMINEEKYIEDDDRHTESFRNGVKLAHKILRDKLEEKVAKTT